MAKQTAIIDKKNHPKDRITSTNSSSISNIEDIFTTKNFEIKGYFPSQTPEDG